ncbi:hypothetical protein CDD83_3803 [Cordyceps sp. RAO-2017]|nr:hypothetical protein CDD83_3803 [Cordyceps sp. RAO-2017]
MALINPVHTFIVPFLFVVTVPLAIFAGITTTLAFSILSLRVIVVYLDIALSLLPQCFPSAHKVPYAARPGHECRLSSPAAIATAYPLSSAASSASAGSSRAHSNGSSPTTPTTGAHWLPPHNYPAAAALPPPPPAAPQHQQQSYFRRRRRRPSSATSVVSAGSVTPGGDMSMGLMPSVGAERDFEGVGGWRSDRDGDDDTWTTINSRFELPDRAHARNHHRSPSGGPVTPGDSGVLMMKARARSPDVAAAAPGARTPPSPNSSRARTPSASRVGAITMANSDGYFSLAMSPTAARKLLTNPL